MKKRFVIELGWGVDLHGQDVTKAAERAVKDAISRSCLCGLVEIVELKDINDMIVDIIIASPDVEKVNKEKVLEVVPFGRKSITVKKGGMSVPGLYVKELGDNRDDIVVVNACVVVSIEQS